MNFWKKFRWKCIAIAFRFSPCSLQCDAKIKMVRVNLRSCFMGFDLMIVLNVWKWDVVHSELLRGLNRFLKCCASIVPIICFIWNVRRTPASVSGSREFNLLLGCYLFCMILHVVNNTPRHIFRIIKYLLMISLFYVVVVELVLAGL